MVKRSIATLSIVAGLLVVAAPASAALDDYGPHLLSVGAGKDRGWDGSVKANAVTKAGGEVISDF